MPQVPFRYDVLGFRDFVRAGEFNELEGADAACCLRGLILEKLEKQPQSIRQSCPSYFPLFDTERRVRRPAMQVKASMEISGRNGDGWNLSTKLAVTPSEFPLYWFES
jgi:hypothetical protein